MSNTSEPLGERHAPELLGALLDATRERHQRVERKLLGDGQWTLARYGAMLQAFHQIIAPVEPALCDWLGDVFISPPPMTRAERIRADLEALDRDVLPVPDGDGLRVISPADAYGVAYVLQGSLLGGAIIARQIRQALPDESIPTRYLELYGDGLGGAWKRFCQAGNSFGRLIGPDERQRTTKAAIDAFRAFECALDRAS